MGPGVGWLMHGPPRIRKWRGSRSHFQEAGLRLGGHCAMLAAAAAQAASAALRLGGQNGMHEDEDEEKFLGYVRKYAEIKLSNMLFAVLIYGMRKASQYWLAFRMP